MDPDYELFVNIVQEGSLSGAARRMKLSTPMVSKRLSRLEARLGVELIKRTTRRCMTTNVGQAFYEDISAVVAAARDAEARIRAKTGALSGELRVRTINSLGRLHIARYLKPFLDAHPRLRVEIDIADRPVDLLANRIDVEITLFEPTSSNLVVTPLASDRRILCAAPSYIAERGEPQSMEQLYEHDIVAATLQLPWILKGPAGQVVFNAESRVRTNSSELPAALALAGIGIALRSTWAMGDDLRAGRLVHILPEYESAAGLQICAVYARSQLVPANVRAFVDFMVSLCSPTPPWESAIQSS